MMAVSGGSAEAIPLEIYIFFVFSLWKLEPKKK